MTQRLLAALVGLAILLPAVVWGGVIAADVIVVVAAMICVAEYAAMAFPDDRWWKGGFLTLAWAAMHVSQVYGPPGSSGVVVLLVVLAAMIFMTFRPGETLDRAADDAGRLALGIVWLSFLSALSLLRRADHGLAWIFLVLTVSWLGDTGGYFAGRFLGKHPLYPKVSPKKTWEGVAGGVIFATVGTYVVRALGMPDLPVWAPLVLGPVLCVTGVVGDLSESLLKRAFGVKDSGWIMPGHGGMLDRIDSVLFVAPVALAWVTFVGG
ncbi:MAG: phosphatidate cytidylyltransferase [Alphaproteobacteria bacterium]|nr:phosphatidate cytidylyltransferase [Alphaproteobacteria bacterium]